MSKDAGGRARIRIRVAGVAVALGACLASAGASRRWGEFRRRAESHREQERLSRYEADAAARNSALARRLIEEARRSADPPGPGADPEGPRFYADWAARQDAESARHRERAAYHASKVRELARRW